jgi:hypothetical protein
MCWPAAESYFASKKRPFRNRGNLSGMTFGYQNDSHGEHFFAPLDHESASHDARAN